MNKQTSKTFGLIALCLMYFSGNLYAQDRVVLGEIDGIEIAYEIQFLGTDTKKNASKNKDEYQIIGYLTNKTADDLYTQDITPIRVEVTNASTLTKSAKPNPTSTQYMTIENRTLYVIKAGETVQDQAKVKVQAGVKPVVNYNKDGLLQLISGWKLKMNAAVIDGTWQFEGGASAVSLRFDEGLNVIVQSGATGLVTWYAAPNDVYERSFVGVGVLGGDAPLDATATYRATLSMVEPGRLLYTNSEGVSAYLVKQ